MWKITLLYLTLITNSLAHPIKDNEESTLAVSTDGPKENTSTVLLTSLATSAAPSSVQPMLASSSPTSSPESETSMPTRPKITYDQRQEGKYNIRADLENFVIVVIPSSPTNGISLLDLLTRSNHNNNNNKHHRKSHVKQGHKKYHPSTKSEPIDIEADASGQTSKQNEQNYLQQYSQNQQQSIDRSNNRGSGSGSGVISIGLEEQFIEGRTPYHVDISSTELLPAAASLQSTSSLSVPSALPLANSPVLRVIRPSNSEENPTLSSSYNKGNSDFTVSVLPRTSKSLFELNNENLLNTNSLLLPSKNIDNIINNNNNNNYNNYNNNNNNNINNNNNNNNNYNGDDDDVVVAIASAATASSATSNGDNIINLTDDRNNSFDSLIIDRHNDDDDDDDVNGHSSYVGGTKIEELLTDSSVTDYPSYGYPKYNINNNNNNNGDGWELTLLGAQEQCGPDRRRDSYGVCQFVSY